MSIISKLKEILDSSTYARENPDEVIQTFQRLSVKVSKDVEEFFVNFAGGKKRHGSARRHPEQSTFRITESIVPAVRSGSLLDYIIYVCMERKRGAE